MDKKTLTKILINWDPFGDLAKRLLNDGMTLEELRSHLKTLVTVPEPIKNNLENKFVDVSRNAKLRESKT